MFKKYLHLYILAVLLVIGLFFRVYKLSEFYIFEHDQDLYSWIVKDILVDGHLRLIGQVTSIEGLFIGPFYYYLLAPFYFIFNMNPLAAMIPANIINLLTAISLYWVLARFFDRRVVPRGNPPKGDKNCDHSICGRLENQQIPLLGFTK